MTNNMDGTWSVKTSTIRWIIGTIGTLVLMTISALSAAVGGFWSFSSEVRTDIAVMKTQIAILTDEIHDLRQSVDAGRVDDRNRNAGGNAS